MKAKVIRKGGVSILPLFEGEQAPPNESAEARAEREGRASLRVHVRMIGRERAVELRELAKSARGDEGVAAYIREAVVGVTPLRVAYDGEPELDLGPGVEPEALYRALHDLYLSDPVAIVAMRAQVPTLEQSDF